MSATQIAVPYQAQPDAQTSRSCGAACLSMVYGSFGEEVSQAEIWPAIAQRNRFGSLASTTHLMTQDALNRGFEAVAIQARHPLQVLRICRDSGVRAILNHRLRRDLPTGHYSVLVDIDDQGVVLHDPSLGPSRRLKLPELLELWLPYFANSEIVGNVVIAVAAARAAPASACEFCRTPLPREAACPRCKKPVAMLPGSALGCASDSCIARLWNFVCCPGCDHAWSFNAAQPASSAAPGARAIPALAQGPDVDKLFAEIDKFCNHILSTPAAAEHPEVRKQLDFISASKEKFKLAYAEQLAHRDMRYAQLNAMVEEVQRQEQAQNKVMEELKTPSPPLDGDALGRALLKDLGLQPERNWRREWDSNPR